MSVDLEALARWMDEQHLESGPIESAQTLAGGTQNILLRFRRGEREFVLRRPPLHLRASSNETLRREARVLSALKDSGVPHPRLLGACADESVLGATFYLMEPVEGFNPRGTLPAPHSQSATMRHRMGEALVEGIATLGALDYVALGLETFGKPEGFLHRQVDRWRKQLESYSEHAGWPGAQALPHVETVAQWLTQHVPASFQPGIIHGDYHLSNVMYRHDSAELAAIVDWELATIGDPLIDLGWLIATWPPPDGTQTPGVVGTSPWEGFPTAKGLIQHYGRCSSRNLDAVQWYAILACYKLGIILEGTHARACAGKTDNATGDRLHSAARALFQRAHGWLE